MPEDFAKSLSSLLASCFSCSSDLMVKALVLLVYWPYLSMIFTIQLGSVFGFFLRRMLSISTDLSSKIPMVNKFIAVILLKSPPSSRQERHTNSLSLVSHGGASAHMPVLVFASTPSSGKYTVPL